MGWWYGTIFALSSHIAIAGGCQKWLIFRSKSDDYGRLVPGQGIHLETILCAISPSNTWDSMILDHFWPPQPYIHYWRVSKMALFLGQNQVVMAGQFQGRELTWKPFHAPYQLPWDHFALSRHPSTWGLMWLQEKCSPLQAFGWYYSGRKRKKI